MNINIIKIKCVILIKSVGFFERRYTVLGDYWRDNSSLDGDLGIVFGRSDVYGEIWWIWMMNWLSEEDEV